jgi:hypothetical protein
MIEASKRRIYATLHAGYAGWGFRFCASFTLKGHKMRKFVIRMCRRRRRINYRKLREMMRFVPQRILWFCPTGSLNIGRS